MKIPPVPAKGKVAPHQLGTTSNEAAHLERLCEWVRLAVSCVLKNDLCIEKHQRRLVTLGESEKRVDEVVRWRQSGEFTESEKAALSMIETIGASHPTANSKRLIKRARAHFNVDEIVALTLAGMSVVDWIELQKAPVRFLVVEDNPNDQELLLRQLRVARLEEKVQFVADGLHALQLMENYKDSQEELIAVFLDIHLPGIGGVELLKRLRAFPKLKKLPVIVLTSSNDPRDIEECQKLNVTRYIEKPVTCSSFAMALASLPPL